MVSLAVNKARSSELVERAAQGERVLLSWHGNPVSVLVPASRILEPIDVQRLQTLTRRLPLQPQCAGDLVRQMRDELRH